MTKQYQTNRFLILQWSDSPRQFLRPAVVFYGPQMCSVSVSSSSRWRWVFADSVQTSIQLNQRSEVGSKYSISLKNLHSSFFWDTSASHEHGKIHKHPWILGLTLRFGTLLFCASKWHLRSSQPKKPRCHRSTGCWASTRVRISARFVAIASLEPVNELRLWFMWGECQSLWQWHHSSGHFWVPFLSWNRMGVDTNPEFTSDQGHNHPYNPGQ